MMSTLVDLLLHSGSLGTVIGKSIDGASSYRSNTHLLTTHAAYGKRLRCDHEGATTRLVGSAATATRFYWPGVLSRTSPSRGPATRCSVVAMMVAAGVVLGSLPSVLDGVC